MRRLLSIFLVLWAVLSLSPVLRAMPTMQIGSPSASYWEHQTDHCQLDFTSYDANCYPASSPNDRFEDGPNTYDYVCQNPWTKFDPLGLSDIDANGNPIVVPGERMATVGGYGNGGAGSRSWAQTGPAAEKDAVGVLMGLGGAVDKTVGPLLKAVNGDTKGAVKGLTNQVAGPLMTIQDMDQNPEGVKQSIQNGVKSLSTVQGATEATATLGLTLATGKVAGAKQGVRLPVI